jgi:hypothetical protein
MTTRQRPERRERENSAIDGRLPTQLLSALAESEPAHAEPEPTVIPPDSKVTRSGSRNVEEPTDRD